MSTKTVTCGRPLSDGRTCRRKHQPGKPCGAKHPVVPGASTGVAPVVATYGPDAPRIMAFHRRVANTDPITGRLVRGLLIRRPGPFRRAYDVLRDRMAR